MSNSLLNCSQRSTEARKLLSSIQKHIEKIIVTAEDKPESFIINSFEQSSSNPLQSPVHNSFNLPSPSVMNIFELESLGNSTVPKGHQSSQKVSQRIHEMEGFYIEKIKRLEFVIIGMEEENEGLRREIGRLQEGLEIERQKNLRIIRQYQVSKNTQLSHLETLHFSSLQSFKIQLSSQLSSQKLLRIELQDELSKLHQQNTYFKSSYKQLSENYRKLLEGDVNRIKGEMEQENMEGMRREIRSVKEKSLRLRRKSKVLENALPEVEKEMKAIRRKMREL